MSARCAALSNFFGSSGGTVAPFVIEQVALAVAREHGAEQPAVAVKIGELRVFNFALNSALPVSARNFTSDHSPRAAAPSGLRCETSNLSSSLGLRCSFGYIASPSDSLSHQV